MAADGASVTTPEEVEARIAREPDLEAVLVRGGYGTRFTATDLHPLVDVFLEKQRGGPASAPPARWGIRTRWLMGMAIVVLLVLLVLALL